MREHVERTGVHVRPAGEPEGAQAPAERVRAGHHSDDRGCVRGQGQDVQAEFRAQNETRADPPRHPVPVLLPERRAHFPPGLVGVRHLVADRQGPVPVAHHAAADGQERVHVLVLDVRDAVLRVRAAVHGAHDLQRAQHHYPGAGVPVLQLDRRRCPGRAAAAQRQQVRVLVGPHRPGPGQHHTRQHGRGHVRDPAVHVGGRAPGVLRVGRRPVRRRGRRQRDDHHAVRVQGQPVPPQRPARGH